ncbi:MAG: hypothetical protein U9R52_02360 [Candidatus Omnitrophota bacterium]|nr:hypothetical protein [Candidatus Omnitrophota bacterium]
MKDNRKIILLSVVFVFTLVAVVLLISWTTGSFYYHFASMRLINIYSYFQLFATAFTAFLICRSLEKENSLRWRQNPSARPFFISAAGFLFLGFDDLFSLHENADKLIHFLLRIKETSLTDHLDDIILLAYGIIAVFFIKDFVKEFRKHPYMVKLIICGLFLFFIMFCLDFISNNLQTFSHFFFGKMSYADLKHRQDVFKMIEESFELIGEASFLAAFAASFTNIKTRKK